MEERAPTIQSQPETMTKAQKRHERRQAKHEREELKRGLPLKPRTVHQAELLDALNRFPVVFAVGPAGTGKTFIPARYALDRLLKGATDSIVITRPTIAAARHRLGFQPGGINAKMRPWLTPLIDAFEQGLAAAQVERFINNKQIEFLPFEFVRGRTIRGTLLVDEAQNLDVAELETLLTRVGEGGQIVICGDPHQNDLGSDSGLNTVADMVDRHRLNAKVIRFDENDVVRSGVAAEWVKAFKAERDGQLPTFLRVA